jgi:glyoxylase-like metal-dependent hydrolase (beta-lactamase superfamily II)
MIAWPLLVRTPDALVLIETGLGNKLTEKQKKIFKVTEDWNLVEELKSLGIGREDITHVILTHYDFDHGGGVVMQEPSGDLALTFPKAMHVVQAMEWEDVLHPNVRSINTYWPINNEMLRNSPHLKLVDGAAEVLPGIRVAHAGGHTRGYQVVTLASGGETAIYPCDLMPTHAHFNPLWLMAYDNFPFDAIRQKELFEKEYIARGAWFLFYHDPLVLACTFDEKGNILKRWPEAVV